MRNYLTIGPVSLRVSSRHLAPWGYDRLRIGGLGLLSRTNGGDLVLASYHPRRSLTWYWSVVVGKRAGRGGRDARRTGQWHDYYRLPFGYMLIVSRQDYHRRLAV